MVELKPCPFCGGDVQMQEEGLVGFIVVWCEKCGADITLYKKKNAGKTAAEMWNRRANDGQHEKSDHSVGR